MQVEPQEKKKTPKGRAKKRITYTRRFVNVTMTGGKRKVSLLLFILWVCGGVDGKEFCRRGMEGLFDEING